MKIVKSSFKEIFNENPQKHIEQIARTCYKSNDLITKDSDKKMIKNLYDRNHWAMLEHFVFIYKYKGNDTILKFVASNPYFRYTFFEDNIISFNARVLLDTLIGNCLMNYINDKNVKSDYIDLLKQVIYDYNCPELFGNITEGKNTKTYEVIRSIDELTHLPEKKIHGWKSIKFICDRGVSHEIVRHRDASFAQESTRYCNYSKDKFGNEITVIKPSFYEYVDNVFDKTSYDYWIEAMEEAEKQYFNLLKLGSTPQEARSVLPNSLKTEIIMTARFKEWAHFFELRCDKAAHPQMRELAIPLFNYFNEKESNVFNRENIKFDD